MSTRSPKKPLDAAELRRECDPQALGFTVTSELALLDDHPGQDRAIDAIKFGIGMRHEGYNLYVLGPEGLGRHPLVMELLRQQAASDPVPSDWVYVHDFDAPTKPLALELPAGRGRDLRDDLDELVQELEAAIPATFETEAYRARREALDREFESRQEQALSDVKEKARERGIGLATTPTGIMLVPMQEGRMLRPDEIHALPEPERDAIERRVDETRDDLARTLREAPRWAQERQERLRELDRGVTTEAVSEHLDRLRDRWREHPGVLKHLDALQEDIIEHANRFRDEPRSPMEALLSEHGGDDDDSDWTRRYRVNVFVDHAEQQGAPVVYEDHPTLPALLGRVDHQARFGALVTDFTQLHAGALHRANGGYLVLDALKVLQQPLAWEQLKRALRSSEIRIESLGQAMQMVSTVSLEPQPVPLATKVVLIGTRWLYALLYEHDPDFRGLFKVPADLEEDMGRDGDGLGLYARMVATIVHREGLRPFHRHAVARVLSHASRLAGDARKLTLHVESLTDLLRESDHWAGIAGRETVASDDVRRAIDAGRQRAGRVRDRVLEAILRDIYHVRTEGRAVGQVNGLMVVSNGQQYLGRPGRITARVRMGRGQVLDIEREVHLGGPVHSKGVLILQGFVGARYATDRPLALSASIVFEQSYGGVEGDSASLGETCALLSALADAPLRQDIAITGSIDQHGRVQAVGGVNEKIEGFFDVCNARGLTGSQGVVLPASNAEHLMLREDVVEAAAAGRFHVWTVASVDEALALLTDTEVGERGADGLYPSDSLNARVEARLRALAEQARHFGSEPQDGANRPEEV